MTEPVLKEPDGASARPLEEARALASTSSDSVAEAESGKPQKTSVAGSSSTDIATRLPAPPPDDRRTWTDAALFVAIHQHRGNLTAAAQAIGLGSAAMIRSWAKRHPDFNAALGREIDIARETRTDLIRKTAYDLAIDGVPKYEYANDGTLLRKTIVHDPKHVAWLAEREDPEHFHLPTRHEHTGTGGQPIRFKFEMDDGPLNINDRDETDTVDGELEDGNDIDDADWAAA